MLESRTLSLKRPRDADDDMSTSGGSGSRVHTAQRRQESRETHDPVVPGNDIRTRPIVARFPSEHTTSPTSSIPVTSAMTFGSQGQSPTESLNKPSWDSLSTSEKRRNSNTLPTGLGNYNNILPGSTPLSLPGLAGDFIPSPTTSGNALDTSIPHDKPVQPVAQVYDFFSVSGVPFEGGQFFNNNHGFISRQGRPEERTTTFQMGEQIEEGRITDMWANVPSGFEYVFRM